jgi:hypothetical protein
MLKYLFNGLRVALTEVLLATLGLLVVPYFVITVLPALVVLVPVALAGVAVFSAALYVYRIYEGPKRIRW